MVHAYAVYVRRGSESGIHSHPWYYYLELLLAFRPAQGFFWSEGLIAGLAVVGMLASLRRNALPEPQRYFCRFLTFYTLTLTTLYAAISYKTPWCLLSFFHGMVLLAGVGAWHLLRLAWLPWWARDRGEPVDPSSAPQRRYPWFRLAAAILLNQGGAPWKWVHDAPDLLIHIAVMALAVLLLAAAASLVMGQAAEGTPVVHVRGFPYELREATLHELLRPKEQDLFR